MLLYFAFKLFNNSFLMIFDMHFLYFHPRYIKNYYLFAIKISTQKPTAGTICIFPSLKRIFVPRNSKEE